jgi:hypothetical protein
MPRKRKVVRRRRLVGAGIFDSIWSGIKSVAKPVNDLLRSTKVISTLAPFIPVVGSTAGKVAGSLGYGRRKRKVRRARGGNKMFPPYGGNPGFAPRILPVKNSRVLIGSQRKRGGYSHMARSIIGGSNLAF